MDDQNVYNGYMAIAWVECWKCELCGHRWIKGGDVPRLCAKCKKTGWHTRPKDLLDQAIDRSPAGAIAVSLGDEHGNIYETRPVPTKPDMQALRDICAGKTPCKFGNPTCPCPDGDPCHYEATETTPAMEIPICGKDWWEDGTHYECIMDKGHRDQKHGLRGMVQRLED